ncbi:MAG: LLM class flavin-dependent oxidoreductase, partial [Deltaproteobacteria bacterium]|nr:LLM class flavin-dependent oxidoreductase [Deltaproteobacteria bacterium]
MSVRFCLAGSARERQVETEIGRAVLAEELGFEGMFFSEGIMSGLDPFQICAMAAARTKRVLLGTAIMTMAFREPVVIANQAVTLNEATDGRVFLGLGSGDATVYTMARTATPLVEFEKGVRLIRDLVNGKSIPIPKGKEQEAGEARLRSGKCGLPVYVAAAGPRALQMAGRVADGVILGSGFDLRALNWARDHVARGAREAGRDVSDIELMGAGIVCVDNNGDRALELAKGRLANRAHHNFRFDLHAVPDEELEGVRRFMDNFDISKPFEQRSDPRL